MRYVVNEDKYKRKREALRQKMLELEQEEREERRVERAAVVVGRAAFKVFGEELPETSKKAEKFFREVMEDANRWREAVAVQQRRNAGADVQPRPSGISADVGPTMQRSDGTSMPQ